MREYTTIGNMSEERQIGREYSAVTQTMNETVN